MSKTEYRNSVVSNLSPTGWAVYTLRNKMKNINKSQKLVLTT